MEIHAIIGKGPIAAVKLLDQGHSVTIYGSDDRICGMFANFDRAMLKGRAVGDAGQGGGRHPQGHRQAQGRRLPARFLVGGHDDHQEHSGIRLPQDQALT